MKYPIMTFSELFSIPTKNGLTKPSAVRGEGYKMINMGELFANDRLYDIPMELVPLSDSEKEKNQILPGDLLFARQSLVLEGAGKCSIVMDVDDMTVFESHIIRVRLDAKRANPLFYYYYFKSGLSPMTSIVTQCAQAGIRGSDLSKLEVIAPDIEEQNRIANILVKYDDLIENNCKQIKLLEEASQRLYKEWFIDLRFPGHEHTKIVDGVPEGWVKSIFSEKVEIMSGGTPDTTVRKYYEGDIPFYSPKDSDNSFFSFDTEIHISEEGLEHCNSKLYPAGTIIITARGTVGKTTILAKPMAMNQSCYALRSDTIPSEYLFFALRGEIDKLRTMANGGVFNTIIVKTFDNIEMTLPGLELLDQFNKTLEPIMNAIKAKIIMCNDLTEARDRLLTKLLCDSIKG